MTLTIKNADNVLLEAIKNIIRLSSKPYEVATSSEDIYAKEVENIIDQVQSGEIKTRTLEESKIYLDTQISKIKTEYANY